MYAEGNCRNLSIYSKNGTQIFNGQFADYRGNPISFTDEDLPLEILGTWDSNDGVYKMTVSIDNEVISPSLRTATSSQYENVMVEDGQTMRISIKEYAPILTVNEPSSLEADVITPFGEYHLGSPEFVKDGQAVLNNISLIKIYGANGFTIKSVVINGKDNLSPYATGKYQVQISQLIETIEVIVEKTYFFIFSVDDLDKYNSLSIMDHNGEGGKTIATLNTLLNGENRIDFSSLDLPLQVKASWSEDRNSRLFLAVGDVILDAEQTTATSALYKNLNLENQQRVFISLISESQIKAIEEDAAKDMQTLETLMTELNEASEQYSDYVVKEHYYVLVQAIEEWTQKVEEAAKWSLIRGMYISPWSDYDIDYLKYCVSEYIRILKEAKEAEENLKKIEEAAKKDREEVKTAREASERSLNETDQKYPAFAIPADKENILSRYDQLLSDIEKAYQKASATISEYQSPSVTEVLAEISALVTKYQQDVKAAAEKASEEASLEADADRATLSALSAQVDELDSKYSPVECFDSEKANLIKESLQVLSDKINQSLTEIFTTGKYQSPWTTDQLQKIIDEITALEKECNDRLVTIVDQAAKEDLDKVDSLKAEYDLLLESLHQKYAPFCDQTKEDNIAKMFIAITDRITQAASEARDKVQLYKSPEVDNYLENQIKAQMREYEVEVHDKASATMSDAEKAAQEDLAILSQIKNTLENAVEEYTKYVDTESYQQLSNTIDQWSQKVEKAKEDVSQSGKYTTPWSKEELEALQQQVDQFIVSLEQAKKNDQETIAAINAAAQEDQQAVDSAYELWQNTLSETQSQYPAFDSFDTKGEIENRFTALSQAIEQAKKEALDSMTEYISPGVNQYLAQINQMIRDYQQEVETSALKAMEQAKEDAETDLFLLSMLRELVVGINLKYAPLECIDSEEYNSILTQIQTFESLIQQALEQVYSVGSYQTPWSLEEIKNLKDSIQRLEQACIDRLQELVEQDSMQDIELVINMKEEFTRLCENIHNIAGVNSDTEREEKIAQMFDQILEKIQQAQSEAVKNAQRYTSPDITDSLDKIEVEIKAYKQEIIDQIIAKDAEILTDCNDKLQDIFDLYNPLYQEFIQRSEYQNLCQQVIELQQRLNQAGEQALDSTVKYQTPWTQEEITNLWNSIEDLEYQCIEHHYDAVQEAANVDRMKVNEMKTFLDELLKELDNNGYADARYPKKEAEIELLLNSVLEKIETATTDAINKTQPYVSPNVEAALEEINKAIETYKNYVTSPILTDEEIDKLFDINERILEELVARLDKICFLYPDHVDMNEYQSIHDTVHSLYLKLCKAEDEAFISHHFTTPWTQEEIDALNQRIDVLEQKTLEAAEADGITSVEADPEDVIYYDLNGFRVKNPVQGKLYIRLQGGKAQKIIL